MDGAVRTFAEEPTHDETARDRAYQPRLRGDRHVWHHRIHVPPPQGRITARWPGAGPISGAGRATLHYGLVERVGQDLYITAVGRTAWEDREARGLYDLAHVVRDD
jgi:hypothetical protein